MPLAHVHEDRSSGHGARKVPVAVARHDCPQMIIYRHGRPWGRARASLNLWA
jgi:hypothetical protein